MKEAPDTVSQEGLIMNRLFYHNDVSLAEAPRAVDYNRLR